MVLAESVQIDGRVVLLFLVVLGLVVVGWFALLILGARTAYRAAIPGAPAADRQRLVPLVSIDLGLLALSFKHSGLRMPVPFTAPAVVHLVSWLLGRAHREWPPAPPT